MMDEKGKGGDTLQKE